MVGIGIGGLAGRCLQRQGSPRHNPKNYTRSFQTVPPCPSSVGTQVSPLCCHAWPSMAAGRSWLLEPRLTFTGASAPPDILTTNFLVAGSRSDPSSRVNDGVAAT